jgi:hypothetical protein
MSIVCFNNNLISVKNRDAVWVLIRDSCLGGVWVDLGGGIDP